MFECDEFSSPSVTWEIVKDLFAGAMVFGMIIAATMLAGAMIYAAAGGFN